MSMTDEEYERRRDDIRAAWDADKITDSEFEAQKRALRQERGTVVWIAVNEDGDSVASTESADDAKERLLDEIGGFVIRIIRRRFMITFPAVESGDDIIVPDTAGVTESLDTEAAE